MEITIASLEKKGETDWQVMINASDYYREFNLIIVSLGEK